MAINFLNNVDYNQNQLFHPTIENQASDAAAGTPVDGQLYYNTSATPGLKVGENGAWVFVGDNTDTNNYVTGGSVASGTVTLTRQGLTDVTFAINNNQITNGAGYITSASLPTVGDGTLTVEGTGALGGTGTFTANQSGNSTISVTHDTFGTAGTYAYPSSITTNSTGHVTAITAGSAPTNDNDYLTALSFNTSDGVLTATVQNQSNVTVDLDGRYLTGNETITLTGEVTGSGTTAITTTVANGVLDVANFNASAIVIESEGIENNDNDTTLPTSAAVKAYVDASTVGGLIYQGGYDANLNSPDLTTSPNSILKGWTYTVTADGTFFTEQLRVGDVLIAEVDDPSALGDWTTVQNNIDLASLTQVGIGNVNASILDDELGIEVAYAAGTAKVGLDIDGLALDTLAEQPSDYFLPIYDAGSGINNKAKLSELLAFANSVTSKAYTITDTDTITYPFTLTAATQNDTIIQLVDTVTNETVYADVDRISTTQATITFATTPTNSVRVLVQKIG